MSIAAVSLRGVNGGFAVITPFLAIAMQELGWRWAAVVAGGLFLAGGIPLSMAIRRSPESIGMASDGGAVEN